MEPARAIARSVLEHDGHTIVVMMSRQAGKNELSAHVEAFLLALFHKHGGELVKASPTFKPQTVVSRDRLLSVLARTPLRGMVRPAAGYQVHLGQACISFLSASPKSNVVGATADVLLECDEAQDVEPAKWDKDFGPMTASTNATRVMYGTPWTTATLLHRELVAGQAAERRDGQRRVFLSDYNTVQAEVPPYAMHIQDQLARLGPDHPLFLTQYALQTIDEAAGFIPAHRQQLLQGLHAAHSEPHPDTLYAFALDVGGGSEQNEPSAHDWTALTIAEVIPTDDLPVYRIVGRRAWQGANQPTLYAAACALIAEWRPTAVAIDASGLGLGLAERLGASHPGIVRPYVFNRATKSALGWSLLAAIDALRLRDHARLPDPLQAAFWTQVATVTATYGPNRSIDWGIPSPAHDDLLVSAALLITLDQYADREAGFQVIKPRRAPP
jgi:hypothetical protein